MRVISRTSKWAIWSRRFASFALPLCILSVWMHRGQMLASDAFQIVLAIALFLALLAILSGFAAYVRVWQTGDHGWGRASFGIVIGLLCLSPIFYGAFLGFGYPVVNDVSTNLAHPLQLMVKPSSIKQPKPIASDEITQAFPGVFTRFYDLPPMQVFILVEELSALKDWDVRVRRQPGTSGSPGRLNALAMTFMGWRDEVVLRVNQTQTGTQVDMRSTSLNGIGDLGTNGKRIEGFLAELDGLVDLQIRETQ